MIMKIKVKNSTKNKVKRISKGDWVDLYTSTEVEVIAPRSRYQEVRFNYSLLSLGVAMQLPKYFEANIVPRSSTFMNFGIIQSNSMGIIDHTYCGNNDEWKLPVIPFENKIIPAGTRIAQFRIRPSQFAPMWVKLKWLFTNKVEFIEVDSLDISNRGGFGSTGNK